VHSAFLILEGFSKINNSQMAQNLTCFDLSKNSKANLIFKPFRSFTRATSPTVSLMDKEKFTMSLSAEAAAYSLNAQCSVHNLLASGSFLLLRLKVLWVVCPLASAKMNIAAFPEARFCCFNERLCFEDTYFQIHIRVLQIIRKKKKIVLKWPLFYQFNRKILIKVDNSFFSKYNILTETTL